MSVMSSKSASETKHVFVYRRLPDGHWLETADDANEQVDILTNEQMLKYWKRDNRNTVRYGIKWYNVMCYF